MLRDNRGLDIDRDLNKLTTAEPGLEAETSLGQTTIRLDVGSLDLASAIDGAADFVPIYDASGNIHKKILPNTLPDATLTVQGSIVEVFTSDGVYVKPSGATAVYITVIGGGGGGGGAAAGTGTAVTGGAGGGGAGFVFGWIPASDIPASVNIQVGVGGAGGIGGTHPSNGTAGSNGTSSKFGDHIIAHAGGGGAAGVSASEAYANGGYSGIGMYNGISGGNSDDDANAVSPTDGDVNCGGGGGGGAMESTAQRTPARGSHVYAYIHGEPIFSGGGGAAGVNSAVASGTNGGAGGSSVTNAGLPGAGGGGGGCGGGAGNNGGNGGAGGLYGAGGGGGGCIKTGTTGVSKGGNGGKGGDGIVVVYTFL